MAKCTRCKQFIFLNFDKPRTLCSDCERTDKIAEDKLIFIDLDISMLSLTAQQKILNLRNEMYDIVQSEMGVCSHIIIPDKWVCSECGTEYPADDLPYKCECNAQIL
jgi:hypothetical protein